jgi:hypothetical protein
MKNSNDLTFVSLLQDENFLELAKNRDVSDHKVKEFINTHPGNREIILLALEFVRANLSANKSLAQPDALMIWETISGHFKKQKRKSSYRQLALRLSKIAAILVLVLSGTYMTYRVLNRPDRLEQMAADKIEAGKDAVIVLSDGSKHNLGINESRIEYSADGKEVIVRDEKKEQEKLDNTNTAEEDLMINQVIVPFGQRHSILLSDGTRVRLNSGSKLVFPAEFKGKTRNVFLKGEGYFEVTKNQEKPFVVKTEFIELKVLGTTFNISAYEDEQVVTAVLVEGKVIVNQKDKLFGKSNKELNPGQGCFYSVGTSTSEVRNVDVSDYVSWKDGLFRFKDLPLKEVLGRVHKYYNKSISVEGEDLSNTIISGKLVLSDDFEEVMNYLAKTLEVHYDTKDKNTYILRK